MSGGQKQPVRDEGKSVLTWEMRKRAGRASSAPHTGVAMSKSLTARPTSQGCCEGEMTECMWPGIGKFKALNTCKQVVSLCCFPSLTHSAWLWAVCFSEGGSKHGWMMLRGPVSRRGCIAAAFTREQTQSLLDARSALIHSCDQCILP